MFILVWGWHQVVPVNMILRLRKRQLKQCVAMCGKHVCGLDKPAQATTAFLR